MTYYCHRNIFVIFRTKMDEMNALRERWETATCGSFCIEIKVRLVLLDPKEADSTFDKGECYGYFQHLSIPVGAMMSQTHVLRLGWCSAFWCFELCVCVCAAVFLWCCLPFTEMLRWMLPRYGGSTCCVAATEKRDGRVGQVNLTKSDWQWLRVTKSCKSYIFLLAIWQCCTGMYWVSIPTRLSMLKLVWPIIV